MLKSLANIFKIHELRQKILITLALIFVYRLGCFIPTPGVDGQALSNFFDILAKKQGTNIFGFVSLFTGGALKRLSVFALGIMPYISASIIMQLLTAVIPSLEKLAKEGKSGYEKINQFTRYVTLVLCIIEGLFLSFWLSEKSNFLGVVIVPDPSMLFHFTTVLTLTVGTLFVMWLGEQIQERGVGNGISLIITASILSRLPVSLYQMYILYSPFDPSKRMIRLHEIIALLAIWLLVILAVVLFSQAQRRIPVQYARRVVGRKIYGGQSTYLPIRVDMAGVIAIIFAQSVLLFPSTIATMLPKSTFVQKMIMPFFNERGLLYNSAYVLLVFFFMYFYTAIVFNPIEIANGLKKHGGFIPGVRPGDNTAKYLDYVATRLVFAGSAYIALIAIVPALVMRGFHLPSYELASFFGGTTILIFVGVMLDTMRQIESQLMLQHYDGFLSTGRIKGRR